MVAVFDYRAATSIGDAQQLLAQYGDDAKVLAGGQSLIALINLGLARPSVLVDVSSIPDLARTYREDGTLVIGATTRHAAALASDEIRAGAPLVSMAMPMIGDPQVRNRGTVGGSIAHADPAAELPAVAMCLGASMRISGLSGARDVAAADFFTGYLSTTIQAGELLTEVRFPAHEAGTGYAFLELVRRKGDFAIVAAAAAVKLTADGRCSNVRLAFSGVAPTPHFAGEAGAILEGQTPSPERIAEAARAACSRIDPESDVIASAAYRRDMAEVYGRRALTQALANAGCP